MILRHNGRMLLLEQLRTTPAWRSALEVALTRPPGVPERRSGEDPWSPEAVERPRRATDDLAWLRQAVDEPGQMGLNTIDEDPRVRVWEVPDETVGERLERLLDRGILDAAGFQLHRADLPPAA